MQSVKVFEFDMEKISPGEIETQLNTYVENLKKTDPGIKYTIFSMGYLKIWRFVIYF